jgi:hypothetical protein
MTIKINTVKRREWWEGLTWRKIRKKGEERREKGKN